MNLRVGCLRPTRYYVENKVIVYINKETRCLLALWTK